jgi:hypothetical protein
MIKLNGQDVKRVYAKMAIKYDATIIRQEDIEKAVTQLEQLDTMLTMLRLMGVWNPVDHLKRWAGSMGRLICVPWTPGEGEHLQLVNQLAILCHELTHREQWRTDDCFAINYPTSRPKRAHYEVLATQPELEVWFHFTGKIPGTRRIADKLVENYFCRPEDAQVAKKSLNAYAKVVRQGAIGSPIVKDMLAMLD